MKPSTTTAALFFSASALTSSSSVQAMVSPAVKCCEENGGTYEIVHSSDGESGICTKNGVYTEEMLFMQESCPTKSPTTTPTNAPTKDPSTKAKYYVYAVNTCDATVKADFTLKENRHGERRISHVEVKEGDCVYVGPSHLDTVKYDSTGSFVAGGFESCTTDHPHESECNLLGMAENACVVNLC